jgi:hypothetical protein
MPACSAHSTWLTEAEGHPVLNTVSAGTDAAAVSGEFVDFDGERFYAIRNVDRMPMFFISVVSDVDHWLFVSSSGGLTAGRVSPDTALFPYITNDRIHESNLHTGPRTLLRVESAGRRQLWEPFNREHDHRYATTRNLYKNTLGNKLCFEEINHDLGLSFRYTWASSDSHGFVRQCRLSNVGETAAAVDVLDGLQNLLPAGTPRFTQTNSSNLVDAYKWTELDTDTGLALFTLYSGITDRAEPAESLNANVAYCTGLQNPTILLCSAQLDAFRRGETLQRETHRRGIRGAFFVNTSLELSPGVAHRWQLIADIERSQRDVVALRHELARPQQLVETIAASIDRGSDRLAKIMASCDAPQATAEENVTAHHYANVLFNVLRGGYFPTQYEVVAHDFRQTLRGFNRPVFERHAAMLDALPNRLPFAGLLERVEAQQDPQLARLCREYLPIAFGRRHGDPSRPWNQFEIRLTDDNGEPLLSYQGNWRDVFQNWEALALSYPDYIENMVAKFVNASTMDGYNPYRITKDGFDWEVEDLEDPWSYIGYWGDHQIIYLLKLLELSRRFHPARLGRLLHEAVFAYANVPYRIRPFSALLDDPKHTVDYDEELSERIEALVQSTGADGKLVFDENGQVYQVTLLEKLLIPLLSKLGNLVVDGGIWLNTQRPEWNDANNALVGQGLSMVTLYYLRRYISFLQQLLQSERKTIALSNEVARWLTETADSLHGFRPMLDTGDTSARQHFALLTELGEAASRFRETVYRERRMSGTSSLSLALVRQLLDDARAAIDHSIRRNRRDDGLFHAYNLMSVQRETLCIETLYPMLEGQVAALSSGAVHPRDAVAVLEALFASPVYRADQHTFMLYPDRALPAFLDKNRIPPDDLERIDLLSRLIEDGNEQIVLRDADGCYRFNASFANAGDLNAALDALRDTHGEEVDAAREEVCALYEQVFDHRAFTGRSGTMFGFEGLGCIYWHMVSKLLLAVQENFFVALDTAADAQVVRRLGQLYYRVRAGIGFNKTPAEYGAFPTDPYSHTPGHSGARQPGMTGQVKEEILTRFGELGIRVSDGAVRFQPRLLRALEFCDTPSTLRYLDVDGSWQHLAVPAGALAFTWCQVPVLYRIDGQGDPALTITYADGEPRVSHTAELSPQDSAALFLRNGRVRQLSLTLGPDTLFVD